MNRTLLWGLIITMGVLSARSAGAVTLDANCSKARDGKVFFWVFNPDQVKAFYSITCCTTSQPCFGNWTYNKSITKNQFGTVNSSTGKVIDFEEGGWIWMAEDSSAKANAQFMCRAGVNLNGTDFFSDYVKCESEGPEPPAPVNVPLTARCFQAANSQPTSFVVNNPRLDNATYSVSCNSGFSASKTGVPGSGGGLVIASPGAFDAAASAASRCTFQISGTDAATGGALQGSTAVDCTRPAPPPASPINVPVRAECKVDSSFVMKFTAINPQRQNATYEMSCNNGAVTASTTGVPASDGRISIPIPPASQAAANRATSCIASVTGTASNGAALKGTSAITRCITSPGPSDPDLQPAGTPQLLKVTHNLTTTCTKTVHPITKRATRTFRIGNAPPGFGKFSVTCNNGFAVDLAGEPDPGGNITVTSSSEADALGATSCRASLFTDASTFGLSPQTACANP